MYGKLLIIGSIAALLPRFIALVISLGLHKTLYDHSPGQCRLIPGIEYGSEDIQITSKGIALITSGLKYRAIISTSSPINDFKASAFALDLNQADAVPKELKRVNDPLEASFNPHGVSIWESKTGEVFLYVINHLPDNKEVVDKYLYDGKTNSLILKRRVEDVNFHTTNDLVVVGEDDQFYLTNFLYSGNKLEMIFRLHWGTIVFFDGQKSRFVADNLLVPNGIAASRDGKYIYFAENGNTNFIVYNRNKDNSLTLASKTPVHTGLDNLDVDSDGEVWTGCHPVGYLAGIHLEDPSKPAPSQVLKIKVNGEKVESIQEMYVDSTGETISGSSIAARYKNKLLIGTVNHKALICDI